jgi:hypothetical protein
MILFLGHLLPAASFKGQTRSCSGGDPGERPAEKAWLPSRGRPLRRIRSREEYTRKQSSYLTFYMKIKKKKLKKKLLKKQIYMYCSFHKLQSCFVVSLRTEAVSYLQ